MVYATLERIGSLRPIEISNNFQRTDQYPAATRQGAENAHGHAGPPYGAFACMSCMVSKEVSLLISQLELSRQQHLTHNGDAPPDLFPVIHQTNPRKVRTTTPFHASHVK